MTERKDSFIIDALKTMSITAVFLSLIVGLIVKSNNVLTIAALFLTISAGIVFVYYIYQDEILHRKLVNFVSKNFFSLDSAFSASSAFEMKKGLLLVAIGAVLILSLKGLPIEIAIMWTLLMVYPLVISGATGGYILTIILLKKTNRF